ncbi:hypothetical protein HYW76_02970 [Candidatus Pacearchaeota archaeon]|nr:hypothetical protein [Candidatus Pacearchaeota archaeon]
MGIYKYLKVILNKKNIDNCIGYSLGILQFSICITATEEGISHAVIHNGNR